MDEQKDENVMTFMMGLVQEKHGDDVDANFLKVEADRLYMEFGERLVSYFEPMLTDDQKEEFDNLVESASSQDVILEFLTRSIDNLEGQIINVLMQFKTDYINGVI